MTKYDNYAEMLTDLKHLAFKASEVEGATDIGALLPIRRFGSSRAYGEFSNLSEWLTDVGLTLKEFLDTDGEEVESWDA